MLTRGENYRHASPIRTRIKMTRLNYLSTGIKKRSKVVDKTAKGIGRKAEIEYRAFVNKRFGKRR